MSDVPEMIERVKRAINEALNIYGASDDAARQVIAAMREPTEAMWSAPVMADCFVNGVYPSGEESEAIWRAMIDAAVAPKTMLP